MRAAIANIVVSLSNHGRGLHVARHVVEDAGAGDAHALAVADGGERLAVSRTSTR